MQRRPREPQPADPIAPERSTSGQAPSGQASSGPTSSGETSSGTLSSAQTAAPDLASFEAMMLEIERITASLERGDLPLQDSLAAFERASLLTKQAQRLLEQAEDRLTRLVEGGPGEVLEVPFSLDQTGRKDEG